MAKKIILNWKFTRIYSSSPESSELYKSLTRIDKIPSLLYNNDNNKQLKPGDT